MNKRVALVIAVMLCVAGCMLLVAREFNSRGRALAAQVDRTKAWKLKYLKMRNLCGFTVDGFNAMADALDGKALPNSEYSGKSKDEIAYAVGRASYTESLLVEKCVSDDAAAAKLDDRIGLCRINQDYKCIAELARQMASLVHDDPSAYVEP